MTFKYRYRKQIIAVMLFFLFLIGSGTFLYFNFKPTNKPKREENLLELEKRENEEKKSKEKEETASIMVDVKGEVINPGIYTLEKEKRVIDAINMAGGLTKNADTSVLNLSKKLSDEMVIIVYSYYEVRNFEKTKEKEESVNKQCEKGSNSLKNDACIGIEHSKDSNTLSSGKISLNTATQEELMQLEGIGEAKAKAIIEYREKNGSFPTIEDIKKVSGIGDSLFDKIKENITV